MRKEKRSTYLRKNEKGDSLEQQGQLLMQPYASDCHEVVTSAKTKEISKGRWGRGGAS